MKFNKNEIFRLVKFCSVFALMLAFIVPVTSCSDDDDDDVKDPYVKLGIRENNVDKLVEDSYELSTDNAGAGSVSYFIFSNLNDWKVVPNNPDDASWIEIWPNEGQKDGRFYVKIHESRLLEERSGQIDITANGNVYRSFKVNQTAGVPKIWLSMTAITVNNVARPFLITVDTNTSGWVATSDSPELVITSQDGNKLAVSLAAYETADPAAKNRVLTITVSSKDDSSVKATFKVTQKPTL